MPKRSLAYSGLFLLLLISVGVRVRSIADQLDDVLHGTERGSQPVDLEDPRTTIVDLTPGAEAAGIHKGDTLIAVNGRAYTGQTVLLSALHRAKAGDAIALKVRRPDGTTYEASVKLEPVRTVPPTAQEWVLTILNGLMMPVLCTLLAFWVAAVRIRDPQAWILLFLLLSFGEQFGTGLMTMFSYGDWFQPLVIFYHQFFANGWPTAMLLFGIYFPERFAYDRRWPWAKWLLIVPLTIVFTLRAVIAVLQAEHGALALPVDNVLAPLAPFMTVLAMVAIGLFFYSIGTKLGTTENPDARRRLSFLLTGAMVSLTPLFLYVVGNFILHRARFQGPPNLWLMIVVLVPMFFFPVTLAYLIVVHRALDVRVVIRQSVQYALASKALIVLRLAILMAGVTVALRFIPQGRDTAGLAVVAAAIAAYLFLIESRVPAVSNWIDRRFFREAYNADLILGELADKVRTIVDTPTLLETVSRRIAESLHVTRVALLLPQGAGFQPAYSMGYPEPPWAVVPETGATIQLLRKERSARVYLDDHDSWIYRPDVAEEERRALQMLESQLLLPLTLNQKLLGILSLGPKQSEAPYSKEDIRMLDSVAIQTGLALENSRLTAEVASEVAQREIMNREIEIAREVQERLFPQDLPEYPGLDYAGSCRPALGVGGDYYDFIRLSDTELGIAIGDVSGKGIPAALLMASLRASLRGQTIRHEDDLAVLMAHVNTLVYESSTSNRYATFFYAQYDTSSRKLTYVNAGHNPPLIFRKDSEILRLETGGPVVGLLPNFPYQQATVELQTGDLLVAFTDGISEAMNSADEEWSEEKLIECAWKCTQLRAEEAMKRIVIAADAFVAGAKQHDDMTIIVAAVK